MNRNLIVDARKCTKLLTLAGVAVFASASAVAQGNMNSQQPNSGSMNGGSNSTMSPGSPANNGAMAGQNGSMGSMPMGGSSAGSMQDKKFAKTAMAGGLTEIQAAQTALQKSNSDDVKKFAQQMIDDHTKLNDQMKPIAMQLGVTVPTQPMPKDQAMLAKMQGLSGDDFDKAYLRAMVKDHTKDDKEFQMEASSGQNADEKAAASQGDQIVKQHLQMAQDLAKTHNAMAGGSKSSM